MREYELTAVYSLSVAEQGGPDASVQLLTAAVEARGGKVGKIDHWGRRRLAYPIGQAIDGDYIISRVDLSSTDAMKDVADRLRAKLAPALVVLGAVIDGKPNFLAATTPTLVERGLHAGNLIREVAKVAGGGGGGRPDIAQAGARDASRLDAALDEARRLAIAALAST